MTKRLRRGQVVHVFEVSVEILDRLPMRFQNILGAEDAYLGMTLHGDLVEVRHFPDRGCFLFEAGHQYLYAARRAQEEVVSRAFRPQ